MVIPDAGAAFSLPLHRPGFGSREAALLHGCRGGPGLVTSGAGATLPPGRAGLARVLL